MRRPLACVAACLLTGLVAVSGPAEQKPVGRVAPPPAPAVDQLVANLGSDDYRTREKAGRDLLARGQAAVPAMRAAMLATGSPEVQRRLEVLVRKLDVERLTAPTRVTLSLKNKTAAEALAAIAEQTGYAIETPEDDEDDEPRHDFAFEAVPFWEAVDRVAGVSNGLVSRWRGAHSEFLFERQQASEQAVYAGPFRFDVTEVVVERSVAVSRTDRQKPRARAAATRLSVGFEAEPKTPVLAVSRVEVLRAVDDRGASLLPVEDAEADQRGGLGVDAYGVGATDLTLRAPSREAEGIKSVKARIGLVLGARQVTDVVIKNPLDGKGRAVTGTATEVEVGKLRPDASTPGGYSLDVKLTDREAERREKDGADGVWTWTDRSERAWQLVELLDGRGNKYVTHLPQAPGNQEPWRFDGTVYFKPDDRLPPKQRPKLGPPATLVVHRWQTVSTTVEFEFKDLPLP